MSAVSIPPASLEELLVYAKRAAPRTSEADAAAQSPAFSIENAELKALLGGAVEQDGGASRAMYWSADRQRVVAVGEAEVVVHALQGGYQAWDRFAGFVAEVLALEEASADRVGWTEVALRSLFRWPLPEGFAGLREVLKVVPTLPLTTEDVEQPIAGLMHRQRVYLKQAPISLTFQLTTQAHTTSQATSALADLEVRHHGEAAESGAEIAAVLSELHARWQRFQRDLMAREGDHAT